MNTTDVISSKDISELRKEILENQNKEIVFMAGCTDLMVKKEKLKKADLIVDLSKVEELNSIQKNEKFISIGSVVSINKIIQNRKIKEHFPILIQALKTLGSPQIRNRATIGGNIVNASPAGDSIPPLMVLEARVVIESLYNNYQRRVLVTDFFVGPRKTVLGKNEFVCSIEIPILNEEDISYYFRKVGQRNALTISKASLAGICKYNKEIEWIRLAAGSVAPTVFRLSKTEEFLIGKEIKKQIIKQAKALLMSEISPIADIRSTVEYRREVTANLLEEFLYNIAVSNSNNLV